MTGHTRAILGIPTQIESTSAAIIDLADRAFAVWPLTDAAPEARIRIDVAPGTAADGTGITYAYEDRDCLIIRAGDEQVRVDAKAGSGRGSVPQSLLATPDALRYGVIEATVLFIITRHDRTPFHAAAIAGPDSAVLLAGPSGTGKSTLAYAAITSGAGLTLLSEDCVYLQTQPEPRIWGWPGFLHLGPEATGFFPELGAHVATVLSNGKRKFAVDTGPAPLSVPNAAVCLLRRTGRAHSLEPIEAALAQRELTKRLEPGFDIFADQLPSALSPFLETGCWRLESGPDPRAAIASVLTMLRAGVG